MKGRLPTTGEEYLRMVREQAKAYPAVLAVQASKEVQSAKNTSAKYRTEWQSLQPAPEGCAPSMAWQDEFLTLYEQDKKRLAAYRSQQASPMITKSKKNNKLTNSRVPITDTAESLPYDDSDDDRRQEQQRGDGIETYDRQNQKDKTKKQEDEEEQAGSDNIPNEATSRPRQLQGQMKLPRANDEQGWHRLLYGMTAAKGQNDPDHHSDADPGSPPSPALLMRLHQGQVMQLLHYHVKWLSSDRLSDREGQWLYALFLRLDPLVESDEVSILRSVAKKCAMIRAHMTRESGSTLASVNMVITLVARVFGQADMLQ